MKIVKNIFIFFIVFSINSVFAVDYNNTCDPIELSFYDDSDSNLVGVQYDRSYDIDVYGKIYTADNNLIKRDDNVVSSCSNDTQVACENNITSGDWFVDKEVNALNINVITTGNITKSANGNITINLQGNPSADTEITGFPGGDYKFHGDILEIVLIKGSGTSNEWVISLSKLVEENGDDWYELIERISFTNQKFESLSKENDRRPPRDIYEFTNYSGTLFDLPSGTTLEGPTKGNLILKRKIFKKKNTGTSSSFSGPPIEYFPSSGSNINSSGSSLVDGCENIDDLDSNYVFDGATSTGTSTGKECTGLNNIFYNNKIKSTKIIIEPVEIPCSYYIYYNQSIIYSSLGVEITNNEKYSNKIESEYDNGTIDPKFSFDTATSTINGGGFDSKNRMIVFATNGNYVIKGLKYYTKKVVNGNPVDVSKIVMSLESKGKVVGDFSYIFNSNEFMNQQQLFNFSTLHDRGIKIVDRNLDTVVYKAGDYKFKFKFYSKYTIGDIDTFELIGSYEFPLTIIPTNKMELSDSRVDYEGNDPLANDSDKIKICYDVKDEFGNIINHDYQTINGTLIDGSASTYEAKFDSKAILDGLFFNIDETNSSSQEAIKILDSENNLVEFKDSKVCFYVTSYAPGKKKLDFKVTLPEHNRDYDITPIEDTYTMLSPETDDEIIFDKPFIGALNIYDDDYFKVGTEQTVKIDLVKNPICTLCGNGYTISNYLKSFNTKTNGYIVLRKNNQRNLSGNVDSVNPYLNSASQPMLDFVLNYVGNNTIDNNYSVLSYPYISHYVNGTKVKYRLTLDKTGGNIDSLEMSANKFYGIKVFGLLQGQGKQKISGQASNFANFDKAIYRRNIKKEAYKYIKTMSSGDTINGVHYVEGDFEINGNGVDGNGNQAYETLIIKNGNLTILGSGKVITKNLGIIIIKDDLADKNLANLYISPDVTYLKSIIYLDGSIISVDNTGNKYSDDSPERTKQLQKQLILEGSLFSRNTIGGAIGDGTNFILPGGKITDDFDEAVRYDLNYIRRGVIGCDINNNGVVDSGENCEEGFIIKYNNENQLNPLKGFNIK